MQHEPFGEESDVSPSLGLGLSFPGGGAWGPGELLGPPVA